MAEINTTFSASPVQLSHLLEEAHCGRLQLPDFQRSWVWDEERIRGLISSISRGFPVGAVMSLKTGGEVEFMPRPLEGTPATASAVMPEALLLDGQQRLTSLYQVLRRHEVVHTITPRRQRVRRWFYLDILACLDDSVDRDEAVRIIPESKMVTSDFGRVVDLDLSTRELEFEKLMVPVSALFNWIEWQNGYLMHPGDPATLADRLGLLNEFHNRVVKSFTSYLIPVIELGATTSKEAVCVVFEKVNTGGKPLDAFELITAMYAAEGYQLRRDWYGEGSQPGRSDRLRSALRMPSAADGVLAGVGNTDFMQAVSLFHTRDLRRAAKAAGKSGKELPKVSANRNSLLNLPLGAYARYQDQVEQGFIDAAKFLIGLGIYRVKDLPYQSQIVPLAAILAELGQESESAQALDRIKRWYWNGVFGELYGSSTETRVAKDFTEVVDWVRGGETPTTVHEATLRADRLRSMRMRLSAAYKGVNALLMHHGAEDFRTGQQFSHTIFFDENVDIHHIFPKDWCKRAGIDSRIFDSIINKTPLSARTNRIIGGVAPSLYLAQLRADGGAGQSHELNERLESHLINPTLLGADDFEAFMDDRQRSLIALIERAIGKSVVGEDLFAEQDSIDEDPSELELLGNDAR